MIEKGCFRRMDLWGTPSHWRRERETQARKANRAALLAALNRPLVTPIERKKERP